MPLATSNHCIIVLEFTTIYRVCVCRLPAGRMNFRDLEKYTLVVANYRMCAKVMDSMIQTPGNGCWMGADKNGAQDLKELFEIHWETVVCDESDNFSNIQTRIFHAVNNLRSKKWILLTGTPMKNFTKELSPQLFICGCNESLNCERQSREVDPMIASRMIFSYTGSMMRDPLQCGSRQQCQPSLSCLVHPSSSLLRSVHPSPSSLHAARPAPSSKSRAGPSSGPFISMEELLEMSEMEEGSSRTKVESYWNFKVSYTFHVVNSHGEMTSIVNS